MRRLVALAAASALLAPVTAVAQSESPEQAYRIMQNTARCFVRGEPRKASAFLAMAPESAETEKALQAAIKNRDACLRESGTLRMKQASFRGAIAERLYLDAYPVPPAAPFGEPQLFIGSGDPKLASYDITRCAASRDPVGADMVVRAELGSPEEKAALARVLPMVAGCTSRDARVGFDRALLHGLLAEALYKLRRASASPIQEAGE